jgi:hypothetical protein
LRVGRCGSGTGRQKMALGRGTPPTLSRRTGTCNPRYGLQPEQRDWAGATKQPREHELVPMLPYSSDSLYMWPSGSEAREAHAPSCPSACARRSSPSPQHLLCSLYVWPSGSEAREAHAPSCPSACARRSSPSPQHLLYSLYVWPSGSEAREAHAPPCPSVCARRSSPTPPPPRRRPAAPAPAIQSVQRFSSFPIAILEVHWGFQWGSFESQKGPTTSAAPWAAATCSAVTPVRSTLATSAPSCNSAATAAPPASGISTGSLKFNWDFIRVPKIQQGIQKGP